MGIFHPKMKIELNSAEVGVVGEQRTISRLTACGYIVLVPLGDVRYDMVIEDVDGRFWRIQCKTGRIVENGAVIQWNCYGGSNNSGKKSRSYAASEVDYFAVYCRELDKVYLVPFDHAGAKRGYIRLTERQRQNNAYKEPRAQMARDYEI